MAGRPERELDDDGTPLITLALRLRALREAAGRPSYRLLSARAHRSQTTLSEAAGGIQVPTWDTVEAYVLGCGGAPEEVRPLWLAAASRATNTSEPQEGVLTPPAEEEAEDESEAPDEPVQRRAWPRRHVVALSGAGVLAALVAAFVLGQSAAEPEPAAALTEAPVTLEVVDGSDPQDTGCARLPGVVLLDTTEVAYGGLPAGAAQLKYSPGCGAVWPRFEPFPKAEIPAGVEIHVDVVRPDTGEERFPFAAPYVGAPVFGNMALSTSDCVYAAVWIDDGVSPTAESRTHCFRGTTFIR